MRAFSSRPFVLLLLLAALAGCSAPARDASADASCEARFAGDRSGNLALASMWQDSPDVVLTRLAEAMGDSPQGEPRAEPDGLRWTSEKGELLWTPEPTASWTPREPPPDARAALAAAVDAFQPPPGVSYAADGRSAWQTLGAERIVGTGAAWTEGALRVGALYEVDERAPLLPAADVAARAVDVAQCVDEDAAGVADLVELRAEREGLVRRARVVSGPEGCEGELLLDLDAATGALAGPVYCGAP